MTTTRTVIGLGLVVAIALVGCSAEAEPMSEPPTQTLDTETTVEEADGGEAAAEEDAQDNEPEYIEAEVGDVVTEDEVDLLPEGQTAYEADDGSLVVVDVEEELPEVLVENILDRVVIAETLEELATAARADDGALAKARLIALLTGRHSVIIHWATSFDINGNPDRSFYTLAPTGDVYTIFRDDRSNIDRQGTLEESVALAEELIAQSEYPERYQIIVHE